MLLYFFDVRQPSLLEPRRGEGHGGCEVEQPSSTGPDGARSLVTCSVEGGANGAEVLGVVVEGGEGHPLASSIHDHRRTLLDLLVGTVDSVLREVLRRVAVVVNPEEEHVGAECLEASER